MTFSELLHGMTWPDLKAALCWCCPGEQDALEDYRILFARLRSIEPVPSRMRILIRDTFRPEIDDEPFREVVGRNGERNREQADFEYVRDRAAPGWADEETEFSLSLHPRAEWLGMQIDAATLNTVPLPQIAAHCLSDMTFYGFDEADAEEVLTELKRRVDELDAMPPEERARHQVSARDAVNIIRSRLDDDRGE